MRNSRSIDVVAGACILTAGLGVLIASCERAAPLDRELHSAIGQALAQESVHLLGPGGRLTVITRDTEAFPQPALDLLFKSFKREAARAHAQIGDVHLIQTDPLRPIDVPPGDFYELIRRGAPGDVIVSFQGAPLLSPGQRAALGQIKPKIVAFCPGNAGETLDLRALFDTGLLHAVLAGKAPSTAASSGGAPIRSSFDQLYQVVRPGSAPNGSQ
jgi:hypothetical protein